MPHSPKKPGVPLVEVESTDRWVAGKTRDELLADLKIYLARLRDNPHSLIDRLRVAAIQLRLGREQEALIHYEGVLRGYVGEGQILSAIALCQRILAIYPELPRIQRILAALYARAPRESGLPHPVTPIASHLEEQATTTFLPGDQLPNDENDPDRLVVRSVFPESRRSPLERRGRDLLDGNEDLRPTMPYAQQLRPDSSETTVPAPALELEEEAIPLTQPKHTELVPPEQPPDPDSGEVLLLTRPKKKS